MRAAETRKSRPDVSAHSLCAVPSGYKRLFFDDIRAPRLTHYLFRFPAKFHPPVAHALLRLYTSPGQVVLDPFCGSGTLLVAAAAEGRRAIGTDVDPVAVFVSEAKSRRYQPKHLRSSWSILRPLVEQIARSHAEYDAFRFDDISLEQYDRELEFDRLWTPQIPNLLHWFRRYVVVDLSRLLGVINSVAIPETHRSFFRLMFTSVIRKVSNADPVPVSGLEVTAHMKRLEAEGRLIDPFSTFLQFAERGLHAAEAYWDASILPQPVSVRQADARFLALRRDEQADAIITSPPYHSAVDYYRRHQLEMFWLGFTVDRTERHILMRKYIGRANVGLKDPILERQRELGPLAQEWYQTIQSIAPKRSTSFLHYVLSMKDAIRRLARVVREDAPVIFVVGHSSWNGSTIPTSDLFLEMAGDFLVFMEKLWYPTKNRYMSYKRRNGADINQEYVLVFHRTGYHGL